MSEINELAAALCLAQAKMPNAAFNRINPHFKSKYADLAAIRDATLPALTENGLSIIQYTQVGSVWNDETEKFFPGLFLHTRLLHKSGQFIEGVYPIQNGTPQQMGSALTYARRYSWGSICGISSEEDDDANEAENTTRNGKAKSAHSLRKEQVYPPEEKMIRSCGTVEDLKRYGVLVGQRTVDWPDTWKQHLRDEYDRRMTELKEGVTEEGTPLKTALKASLMDEIDALR